MGAIRDTLLGYKHQKTENPFETCEDKVLRIEVSEKDSALKSKNSPLPWTDECSRNVMQYAPFPLDGNYRFGDRI